ncbi:MAG TPA: glycosyltransferase family 1 protein [Opitutaceae bacterium]|nr:glycosyltransferase family 1 protein [Opitutaceae bacterium]
MTVHDLIPLHFRVGWKGHFRAVLAAILLRRIKQSAALVITDTHAVARQLESELRFLRARLRPIHLAAHCELALASARMRQLVDPYLIYVGNVGPHKNVEGLMASFAEVCGRVPHRLVIVGQRGQFVGDQRRLTALAMRLGNRVFFTDQVTDEELRVWMRGADLLVQPSFEEGFGLPPLEAMAMGVPVLVSDAPALVETAGQGARVFRLNVPGELATSLCELLCHPELRADLVQRGHTHVRRFSWEATAAATTQVLKEVIAQG